MQIDVDRIFNIGKCLHTTPVYKKRTYICMSSIQETYMHLFILNYLAVLRYQPCGIIIYLAVPCVYLAVPCGVECDPFIVALQGSSI